MNKLGRFLVYTVVIVLLGYSLPLLVEGRDVTLFTENHLVERAQFVLLAGALVLFAWHAWRSPGRRHPALLVSIALVVAMFRELDALLEDIIPWLGWKIGIVLALPAVIALVVLRAAEVRVQLNAFAGSTSFALGWAGLVIAVPVAQLFGHGPFLEALLGEHYHRAYKHLIEESGELVGYFVLLVGGIESHFDRGTKSGDLPV